MNTAQELELLKSRLAQAEIADVQVTEDELVVELTDGRVIAAPLLWFPRLSYGTVAERSILSLHGRAFTGPNWMKTSALKRCCWGAGWVNAQNLSCDGWKNAARSTHNWNLRFAPCE